MTGIHYPNLLLILPLLMNLKCCWTDIIVIIYLIIILIQHIFNYIRNFWIYRNKPLSLYLQLHAYAHAHVLYKYLCVYMCPCMCTVEVKKRKRTVVQCNIVYVVRFVVRLQLSVVAMHRSFAYYALQFLHTTHCTLYHC